MCWFSADCVGEWVVSFCVVEKRKRVVYSGFYDECYYRVDVVKVTERGPILVTWHLHIWSTKKSSVRTWLWLFIRCLTWRCGQVLETRDSYSMKLLSASVLPTVKEATEKHRRLQHIFQRRTENIGSKYWLWCHKKLITVCQKQTHIFGIFSIWVIEKVIYEMDSITGEQQLVENENTLFNLLKTNQIT